MEDHIELGYKQIWRILKPKVRGVNIIFGGKVLEEILFGYFNSIHYKSNNVVNIFSKEFSKLCNQMLLNNLVNNKSRTLFIDQFDSLRLKGIEKISHKYFEVKKEDYSLKSLHEIIQEKRKRDQVFYAAFPKNDLKLKKKNWEYHLEKNKVILQSLKKFAIRNNIYLTLLYKIVNKNIFALSEKDFIELLETYNSIVYALYSIDVPQKIKLI